MIGRISIPVEDLQAPNHTAKFAPDDPDRYPEETVVTCFPAQAILAQVKFMKVVRRIRALKARTTTASEGCINVTPETPVEAMKSSVVEEVTSQLPADPTTEEAIWNNPQTLGSLLSIRLEDILTMKVRPTAEGYTTVSETHPATEKAAPDYWQKLCSLLSLRKKIRSFLTGQTTAASTNGVQSLDTHRYATCPSSPTGSSCSEGYLTCPSSPAAGSCNSPPYNSTCAKVPAAGSSECQSIDSACASFDLQKCSATGGGSDSLQKNSNCPSSYSRRSSGGKSESRKHSTVASSDSRRSSPTGGKSGSQTHSNVASSNSRRSSPTGGKPESQRHPTLTSSDNLRRNPSGVRHESQRSSYSTFASSDSRRFSTGATFSSHRNSASADSESLRRSSTGARFESSQKYPTYAGSDHSRRHPSGGPSEMTASGANSKKVLKALLTASMSMDAFLSIICTEETLVSQPEDSSGILLNSSNERRSSEEVLVRPNRLPCRRLMSSENLDLSTIPTGAEIEAPEDQDPYSNSNISWSTPLEDAEPATKVDHPTTEEPRQSISGRSSTSSIPNDHFAVYIGSERKKFVISSQVVTHQLFKKLLANGNYKLEERDGKIAIVLLCDADYFRRLLFLVDQRKTFDMEALEARRSVSSCSRRSFDLLAPEPRIGIVSSSG
ncbi:unnamed protein product [Calypogeia fissa]